MLLKDMLPKGTSIETYKSRTNSIFILIHSTNSNPDGRSAEHTVWIMIRHDKVQELPNEFYTIENIYLQDPGFIEIKYKSQNSKQSATWQIIDANILQELKAAMMKI